MSWTEMAAEAANFVRAVAPASPTVAVILGSGLGSVADALNAPVRVPTSAIPHFPRSTVGGHAGEVLLGTLGGHSVAILAGRVHGYEGYSPAQLGFSVRFAYAMGCRDAIVTNAAGALNPDFRPGEIMVIEDHISFPSLAGQSPLVGTPRVAGLTRFVDLTNAYSPDLRRLAENVASDSGIPLRRGVYVMVGGPNFETPSEVRMLRRLGGDAVGMSTVPEVIVARQLGMRVLGISVISNVAAGLPGALLGHEDVLATVERAAPPVRRIIQGVLARIPH